MFQDGKREILQLRLLSEAAANSLFHVFHCIAPSFPFHVCTGAELYLIFSFSRYHCSFSKWCARFFSHSRIEIPAPVSSLSKFGIDDHDYLSSFLFFLPIFPVHVKCLFWLSFSLLKLVAFSYSCWSSVYLLSSLSLPQ